MTSQRKLLDKIMRGTADGNVPFSSLCNLLLSFGFSERRSGGSHRIFWRDGVEEILNLQPKGAQAKPYQVKQVRQLILKYKLGGDET